MSNDRDEEMRNSEGGAVAVTGAEDDEEELPQHVIDLSEASVPTSVKGVRACKRCGILKTVDQFINDGCENCPFLDMVRMSLL